MTSPPLSLVSAGTPNSQRIAVLARTGEMELAFALVPEPTDVQVRVKITYVGICGSDLEAYRGSRSPEFMTTPARLGHEVAGVIDKIGASVVGLRVGDQVTCRYVWGESLGRARTMPHTRHRRRRTDFSLNASPPVPPLTYPLRRRVRRVHYVRAVQRKGLAAALSET